jgi:hypothetical protein
MQIADILIISECMQGYLFQCKRFMNIDYLSGYLLDGMFLSVLDTITDLHNSENVLNNGSTAITDLYNI